MATIKFILQSKSNNANIYLRFSIGSKNSIKRKTGYIIDSKNWSAETGLPKKSNVVEIKNLKTDLQTLSTEIEKNYNIAITQGTEINGYWLEEQINRIHNKKEKTDLDRLTNYFQYYIDCLPNKVNSKGKRGIAEGTIKKYKTIKTKIEEFEEYKKEHYYIKDVGLNFINEFIKYLTDIDNLANNTTGRYIKFIKTVCLDARNNEVEIETNSTLNKIKGYVEDTEKVFLTFDELEKIEKRTFKRGALENAKDWLIIGCYIGQRVSDLLILTKDNVSIKNGLELIELTQQKTGKKVAIPLHEKVKSILDKRNGEFPEKISAQKFNLHIKDICKIAEINQPEEGGRMNPETRRKEYGTFPKYELVSSHICRRSFATNFYGDIPTAILKNITSHSTEKQFLEYIGKSETDYAEQLAEYWHKQALEKKKEPQLNIVKEAK